MVWKKAVKHLFLCAAVTLATAAESAPATGSGKFFCCTDASGKQVCGDTLPHACYGRAYRELGQSGQTLREVDAPLTAEQRAKRAAEEELRKEEEVRLKEQQRQDLVMKLCGLQGVVQPSIEQRPVGEGRQRVMMGEEA